MLFDRIYFQMSHLNQQYTIRQFRIKYIFDLCTDYTQEIEISSQCDIFTKENRKITHSFLVKRWRFMRTTGNNFSQEMYLLDQISVRRRSLCDIFSIMSILSDKISSYKNPTEYIPIRPIHRI